MTAVQRAQLRQSEIRSQINQELDKAERDTEALERLTREAQQVEVELRAALVVEEETAIPDRIDTPEGREMTELFRRSSLTEFVDETLHQTPLDGASKELREALLGSNHHGYLPLDMLLDPEERIGGQVETRADAVSNIAAAIQDNQMPIAQGVFARSASVYLGATMPSVSVGD